MTTFSPTLVNDFDKFRTVFSEKEELHKISSLPKEVIVEPKGGRLYYNTLNVVFIIVTTPFRWITAIFLRCIFLPTLYTKSTLLSKSLLRVDWNLLNQMVYGKNLLMPAQNHPLPSDSDVYLVSRIALKDIGSSRIRNHLDKKVTVLDFNKVHEGICHGSVQWFNFLILTALKNKTISGRFDTFSELFRAVATRFEYGAPKQADLLQVFYGLEKELLNLRSVTRCLQEADELVQAVREIDAGVYSIEIHGHELSFIKYNDEEFVFDPNKGLIRIEKPEDLLYEINYYIKPSYSDQKLYFSHLALDK